MPANLLIVESPSKAKTLKKYLGPDFEILASYGHIRDLVPKNGAVDPDKDFAMKYQIIAKNSKHVDAIAAAVREAQHIYLATDPDREGEAISWHLLEILKNKKLLKDKTAQRVVFHEITKNAVLDAVANPRQISLDLVNAQQARRALDYLVGFNLSPLLWKKIRRGLSAGRVQSPALRLICERETEIRSFVTQEYWSIHLDSHKGRSKFRARLTQFQGAKLEQFSITNEDQQQAIVSALAQHTAAQVIAVEKKKKTRKAAPPFTTSTLQQEAVRKLSMTTDRTMRTAQQLYEGVDVGQGTVGLITYMRTDSVALANEAVAEIRHYIGEHFAADYLPKAAVTFTNKAKNAQEAHEAIRPTSIFRTPEQVKPFLTADQFKLYEMVWKRTVACQMAPAKYDTTAVDIAVGEGVFRANGQVLVFPGFIAVYQEGLDDADDDGEAKLPVLEVGDALPVDKIEGEQHFTQPPPRFSEASLVKALEEFGIGRPSTYASIIKTLKDREYVTLDKKRFVPTDTGEVVNKFLTEHFQQYVDYDFTAKLENQLDDVSTGKRQWVPVLEGFWKGFHKQLQEKEGLSRAEVTTELLDEACPKCSKPLNIRFGKRGRFIGCTGYPECDYTRNLGETAEEAAAAVPETPRVIEGRDCPACGGQLVVKTGRYGKFIGCANYPKCKHIEPLEKPRDTGVVCPVCKEGHLIERKSRYGKLFYSCNTYPKCNYATWNPPIAETCPQCQWPVLTVKTTKRRGTEKVCPQKECGYSIPAPELAPPAVPEAETDS